MTQATAPFASLSRKPVGESSQHRAAAVDRDDTIKTGRSLAGPLKGAGAEGYLRRYKAKYLLLKILGQKPWGAVTAASLFVLLTAAASAQGVLTVTPTRSSTTLAGNGNASYTGDNGAATSATVALPRAVAYDANGNLFIADTNNHVVREATPAGVITTVAGSGVEGFGGDNGPATAALLDTPTGVAVDASGNVYIADSHNHRIRKVSGGVITTIAGTGTAGFSGDGAAATAAQLALPSGIAVDATGNIYIADTNNHRIREISNGTITTIAGDGEELFAGDGAAATSAALDSPTGVAVSSTGTVYIADRLNQRVRSFTVGGTITTVAGNGTLSFSGDGAAASSAALARPSGVGVDAAGNVYIADTDNQRIRQINQQSGAGTIATVAGSGTQGFGGDSGPATAAILNSPRAIGVDVLGNLSISDAQNNRVRGGALPNLPFGSDGVGIPSPPQTVTLANTGTAPITVSSVGFTGAFAAGTTGTCSATPIVLAPGVICTLPVVFAPTALGAVTGSITVGGIGTSSQTVLLTGTGVQSGSSVSVTTSVPTALIGQSVTLTATVKPAGLGTATGQVTFYDGTTVIGTSTLTGGSASLTVTNLANGTHGITAAYVGSSIFAGSTSPGLTQIVEDFQLAVSGVSVLSVVPGSSATFSGVLTSLNGPFSYPVVLSLSGLPPGATATFTPPSVTPGATPTLFTLIVRTVATIVEAPQRRFFAAGAIGLALILFPFTRRTRRKARGLRLLSSVVALLCLGSLTAISGCGFGSGIFAQKPNTYPITLIGTATGANGYTLQHTITVNLTVQ